MLGGREGGGAQTRAERLLNRARTACCISIPAVAVGPAPPAQLRSTTGLAPNDTCPHWPSTAKITRANASNILPDLHGGSARGESALPSDLASFARRVQRSVALKFAIQRSNMGLSRRGGTGSRLHRCPLCARDLNLSSASCPQSSGLTLHERCRDMCAARNPLTPAQDTKVPRSTLEPSSSPS